MQVRKGASLLYKRPPKEFGLGRLFNEHPTARAIFFVRSPCNTCEGCRSGGRCFTFNPTNVPGAQPVYFGGAAAVDGRIVRVQRDTPTPPLHLANFYGAEALRVMFEASQRVPAISPGTEVREGWRESRFENFNDEA